MTRTLLLLSSLIVIAGCDAGGSTPPPGTDGSVALMDGGAPMDGGGPPPGTDGGPGVLPRADGGPMTTDAGPPAPPGSLASGTACNCDTECDGTIANPGRCVQGVCMTRSSADCASAGSTGECPTGSRCWGLDGVTGGVCWPDCSSFSCAGTCDADGSCTPSAATTCTASCSEICTETADDGCPENSHPNTAGDGCVCDSGFSVNAEMTACVSDGGGMCPDNSHLNTAGDGCVCDTGFVVSSDMTACVRECTPGGSECGSGLVCVDNMCRTPPCTATSCGAGLICATSGDCVVDLGTPPPGPPPTACVIGSSGIPDWRCTSNCSQLIAFDPRAGAGYEDYTLNGETSSDQYRSFIRRDVMMLVKYASAMVDCQARAWTFGNGGRIGLGDMSEADGSIPGTREMDPGHPARTHENGHDMDIGYFQTGTADNRLRPICEHRNASGVEQNHCTEDPIYLDTWRSALFIGHLHASPNLRVIGVDGRAAVLIESALTQLCSDGWLPGSASACGGSPSIAYELTDTGRFWFRFHHHHMHLSVSAP